MDLGLEPPRAPPPGAHPNAPGAAAAPEGEPGGGPTSDCTVDAGRADSVPDDSGDAGDDVDDFEDDPGDGKTARPPSNGDDSDDCDGLGGGFEVEPIFVHEIPDVEPNGVKEDESTNQARTQGDGRTVVKWHAANLAQVVCETRRALLNSNLPLFVYAGRLASVGRAGSLQVETAEKIHFVTAPHLTLLLSAVIRFTHDEVDIAVPPALVRAIMACPTSPFPRLLSLVNIPALLPGGRLIDKPGFDEASGIYYAETPGLIVPAVPRNPTQAAVQAALALLTEMQKDALFADRRADLAATLAAVATSVVRSAIDGCVPAFVITAASPRIGKSHTVEGVSLILTGETAEVEAFGTDEEVEKRITGHVKTGDPIIAFDNVARRIGGAPIEAAVTSRTWRGRKLRTNDFYTGPMVATIFFTGNRLTYHVDMLGRVVIVKLATDLEHIAERPLQRPDAKAWILANRGRLIAAVLTICRAHMAAGSPDMGLKPMRGFDAWSRRVRSALVWAGTADPLQNLAQFKADADPETEAFGIALEQLAELFPAEQHFTSKDVFAALCRATESGAARFDTALLAEALKVVFDVDPVKLRALGFSHAITKLLDRNVGGLQMKRVVRHSNAGHVYKIKHISQK